MWAIINERIQKSIARNIAAREKIPAIEQRLADGLMSPMAGAEEVLALLKL